MKNNVFIMRVLFLILLLLIVPLLHSQQIKNFCLEGVLFDTSKRAVDYATVTILSEVDSLYVKGNISNEKGQFRIENIPSGRYILSVTHLLYKRKYVNIEVQENTILDSILMEENVVGLDAVTVTANVIQQKIDRYVVFLQGNPITKGNNTKEVLTLLPGVTNEENSLKINGRDVSEIYVDGRKLRDRNELDAIQAENIDKVEIVHMSGSEESASSMGGIINIKLKKMSNGGYYGSVSSDFSVHFKGGHYSDNINGSLNYRNKNLSIYNYTYFGHLKNISQYNIYSHYKEINKYIDMQTDGKGWTNSFSDRLSLTYDITNRHSIGGNFRLGITNGDPINRSESTVKNNVGERIDRSESIIEEKLRTRQYQAALNYDWILDDKGSKIKFIIDYLRYNNKRIRGNSYLYNLDKDNGYEENTSDRLDDRTDMLEIDTRLEQRISDKSQLDIGLNYSLNNSKQFLNYKKWENNIWVSDLDLSDNYKLKGQNYAGFASFSSMITKKITYKVGIRIQENKIEYNSVKISKQNSKNYWGIYPTLNLMYNINEQKGNSISLFYQKAMDPIPYSAITPVVIYNNEYLYTKGNLDIKPVNYHLIMLGGAINGQWNINYLFGFSKDVLFFKTFQDEKDPLVTYTMPVNDGKNYMQALSLDRTFKIAKWWSLKAIGRIQWLKYEGVDINSSSWKPYLAINNNMDFDNGWGGNLSYYLEPTYKTQDRIYKTVHGINGKIYKYLLDNKLLLNLNFTLYRHNRRRITNTLDIWSKRHYTTNETGFMIKVIYNFNGGRKVTTKQSKSIQDYYEYKDN